MLIRKLAITILILILSLTTSGCSEYWWTRGQPPSVKQLVQRHKMRLAQARKENKYERDDFIILSDSLAGSLEQIYLSIGSKNKAEVLTLLEQSQRDLIALEGQVSIGSRAALGELSGQFRGFQNFADNGQLLDKNSFGLFTARALSFLANELSVPSPTYG
jgi:hypothetical protein